MKKKVPLAVSVGLCLLAAACSARPIPINSDLIFNSEELFQTQAGRAQSGFTGALETEVHLPYMTACDDFVRPDAPLTRAEGVEIIYGLLKERPERPSKTVYSDIPQGAWYQGMAECLGGAGMLDLFGPLFAGDAKLTRAEFTVLLMQFFNTAEDGVAFKDVPENHWAYREITAASALGWFVGGEDSSFRPENNISRGEAAAIINRAMGRVPDREALDKKISLLPYVDLPTEHWAYYDILEASIPHQYEQTDSMGERWSSCYLPEAQQAPGCYLVEGELYCVQENNLYARNTKIGQLEFDNQGRYTTGDSELDAQLSEIIQNKTIAEWDQKTNLRVLYRYVSDSFEYWPDEMVSPGEEDWELHFAKKMLEEGRGNCYGFAGLLTVLARKLGYQAKGISGDFRTDFQEWTSHGWVELMIDGNTYICDPEIEGVYAPNRDLDWDLFMKQYGETPTYYSVNGKAQEKDE